MALSAPVTLAPSAPDTNQISYAVVGHSDETPSYARIEGGRPLVEVTLVPSGDEVIARLDTVGTDGGGFYMSLHYGQKVVVGFPNGADSEGVIMARVNDASWPFPDSVCAIATQGPNKECPLFTFMKTAVGELIAIESGIDGDILIHSGASIQLKTPRGSQVLLSGRTHLGADFVAPPVGATVGPAGETVPGMSGTEFIPTPGTNALLPPALPLNPVTGAPWPADGIMRFKDQVQSNITVDTTFWTWLNMAHAALVAITGVWNGLATTTGGPLVVPVGPALPMPPLPPTALASHGASCSEHTASDT